MTVINNFDTWQALLAEVNVQQNGQIPPSVFNKWYNEVSDMLLKKLAEEYELNQVMSDLLSPFVSVVNVLGTLQPGQNWTLFKYPTDYQYFLNASLIRQKEEDTCFYNKDLPIIDQDGKSKRYTDPDFAQMAISFAGANSEERQIHKIDTSRWANALNHRTKGPSFNYPKLTQFKGGLKVAPKGIASIVLTYCKTPIKSVFGYTISAQDIVIYDPGTSVQLEWSDQVLPLFLAELVKKYSKYIGDPTMFQMGAADK